MFQFVLFCSQICFHQRTSQRTRKDLGHFDCSEFLCYYYLLCLLQKACSIYFTENAHFASIRSTRRMRFVCEIMLSIYCCWNPDTITRIQSLFHAFLLNLYLLQWHVWRHRNRYALHVEISIISHFGSNCLYPQLYDRLTFISKQKIRFLL